MLLNIEHHTRYAYSEDVNYTIQELRLTPQHGFGQHVRHWEIKVNGELQPSEDAYGNTTHTLVVDEPHTEILIIAMGQVETGLDVVSQHLALPLPIYLRETPLTQSSEEMLIFAKQYQQAHRQNDALEEMMHALLSRVQYIKGATQVTTSAIEAFALGQGVCQDHAHVFIACCRAIDLPARYVSGYLFTEDGSLMQTHAWADVYVAVDGWQSFDVSNGCRAGETHVRLATGLDYRSASPVSGMRSGGGVEGMASSVIVNQAGLVASQQRKINAAQLLTQAQLSREALSQAALIKQSQHAQQQ
ncbi:transglutaminase family protein [Methylotenera sp. L2L1]|uniref:transglutaminase family protein n=1 Tax=Methylotenera sp. L2L1 TaxID=1502770 RepID=UPI0005696A40|nr:transglutaminase family protein [Methylotenera sp. L2L1]